MAEKYDLEEEKKFLFKKKITCPNCDKPFDDIRVLNSKLRRLESDDDLRPRFQGIDTLKYGVTACPKCGYAAATKNFDSLTKLQRQHIIQQISAMFVERDAPEGDTLDYPAAIERYKLALVCAMAMEVKLSEQAYLCLQLTWLIRGYLEMAEEIPDTLTQKEKEQLQADAERFYRKAFDGLSTAATQEDFPICGMDSSTYDYLLAVLCYKHGEFDQAVRYCGNIVQTRGVNSKIKDKALMLKDEVIAAKKEAGAE